MPESSSLAAIAAEVRTCTACGLCASRTNTVPGSGNPHAELVFIGEAPGKTEDQHGVPFCGASGKLLDSMLESIHLSRDSVFITNTVKCRPPDNRDPSLEEKVICTDLYLQRQLDTIKPKLIITLGRHALSFFHPDLSISQVHGTLIRKPGAIPLLPLFHPAVALYNGGMRETLYQDFLTIPQTLNLISQS
jgi:DNA polymerase